MRLRTERKVRDRKDDRRQARTFHANSLPPDVQNKSWRKPATCEGAEPAFKAPRLSDLSSGEGTSSPDEAEAP
jgi:hypothetical protein